MNDFGLGKVLEWDGEEGLLEDEQGDIIRFSSDDVHPRDKDYFEVGAVVIITENGYLELTSQSFPHYNDEELDEAACFHDDYEDGVCTHCGEQVDWTRKKPT
ncbi:MAG: hypothetical protein EB120_04515 [Proteobacteria bacterium]|nr:hypothetical protein [Pseudomonadota bacterium]